MVKQYIYLTIRSKIVCILTLKNVIEKRKTKTGKSQSCLNEKLNSITKKKNQKFQQKNGQKNK